MPFYKLDEKIRRPWLVIAVTGQWFLFALLITFTLAKRLPQRNNPFLVNFILTTFLATIPPTILLYAGQQHERASIGLCFAQFTLMQGAAPMFGVAQFALVFDTWSELRSSCLHKPHVSRQGLPKYLLILAPYITMCIWASLSFVATSHPQTTRYDGFAYCVLASRPADMVTNAVGWFMSLAGLVGLIFELWVCWMIYSYPAKVQKNPMVWRTNIQFALRVVIYSLLLFMAVTLINRAFHSPAVKAAYQLLNSMNALLAFVVFGTQKSILRVWKFWDRTRSSRRYDESEFEPQIDPTLDWAHIHWRKPVQFSGNDVGYEEMGQRRL